MVRGRFDRIVRSVASTLAAVFSLALPWALGGVPSAQATEEAKPAPTSAPAVPAAQLEAAPKSHASAKAESEKPAPAAQAHHAKHHKKKAKKRLASKETSTEKPRGQEHAAPKADHDEEPNVAAKHETKKPAAKKPQAGGKKATSASKESTSATHDKPETLPASVKTVKTVKADKAEKTNKADKVEKNDHAKPHDSAVAKKPEARGRRSKRASTHQPGAKRKVSKKDEGAEKPPCFAPAISVDRNGMESDAFSLVDCKGHVLEGAREKLSVLARPWGSARPTLPSRKKNEKAELRLDKKSKKDKPSPELAKTEALEPDEIAPNVRLLDVGLLARVETIAKHFPGKGISLVSGYRPKSKGSLHQSARALDLRVAGVPNEDLVAFCKTLEDTGCGYYPNSSFVHVDVRNKGTGSVTWIDASGPGETPRYVTQWPPPPDEKPQEGVADEEPAATPKAAASETTKVAEVVKDPAEKKPVAKEADPKEKGDPGACVPVTEKKEENEAAPRPFTPTVK